MVGQDSVLQKERISLEFFSFLRNHRSLVCVYENGGRETGQKKKNLFKKKKKVGGREKKSRGGMRNVLLPPPRGIIARSILWRSLPEKKREKRARIHSFSFPSVLVKCCPFHLSTVVKYKCLHVQNAQNAVPCLNSDQ
ncbi:hypothetical protein CDAR_239781 [Caerostris darwini]|uniref:Uncharacterized protein n=1 Tax=Caerostris darwini TaxID=1538125 RepID=A0AAV4R192_9ARAC|nr:hypothetical protein CDAR_239781 [Caerostris darwini]